MRKKMKVIFLAAGLFLYLIPAASAKINKLDSLDSLSDLDDSIKKFPAEDYKINDDYGLPTQTNQSPRPVSAPPSSQQGLPSFQDQFYKEKPATDRAVLKNEERLKKLIDSQRKPLGMTQSGEWLMIPKEYRFLVELIAVVLLVTILGLVFYKRKFKKQDKEKDKDGDNGSGDGIVFYDVK